MSKKNVPKTTIRPDLTLMFLTYKHSNIVLCIYIYLF